MASKLTEDSNVLAKVVVRSGKGRMIYPHFIYVFPKARVI